MENVSPSECCVCHFAMFLRVHVKTCLTNECLKGESRVSCESAPTPRSAWGGSAILLSQAGSLSSHSWLSVCVRSSSLFHYVSFYLTYTAFRVFLWVSCVLMFGILFPSLVTLIQLFIHWLLYSCRRCHQNVKWQYRKTFFFFFY